MSHCIASKIVESFVEAIVLLRGDGKVLDANASMLKLLGMSRAEIEDLDLGDIVAEQEVIGLIGISTALSDGPVRNQSVLFQHSDGVVIPTTVSGGFLKDEAPDGRAVLLVRDDREMREALSESARWAAEERARAEEVQRAHDVTERTRCELERAHAELQTAVQARDQAESGLRQAQKLEAVGQLAAGIAHEINTPVQFVSDSLHFLHESFGDLLDVVACQQAIVQRLAKNAGDDDALEELDGLHERADLAYILENVPSAFESTLEGTRRIAALVRSLKEFAHPDSHEKQHADLNRAIEATVEVARNEYKYVAEVIFDLGDIPAIPCHLGELNQVFLNLIVNAAHAIGDVVADTEQRGEITIRTTCDGDDLRIIIKDTGRGIPEDIRERIFDPFFTTKEVGIGTGQGLAIAYQIVVEKHGGTIEVESEMGVGTTFTIRLPAGVSEDLSTNSPTSWVPEPSSARA